MSSEFDWLDDIEGLENSGDRRGGYSGPRAFRGLPIIRFNGAEGVFKDRDKKSLGSTLFGSVLAYSKTRLMLLGMDAPALWEVQLAELELPTDKPLCSWDGGTNKPTINSNLEDVQLNGLKKYGAGGESCRGCALGQWKRVGTKNTKPICGEAVAILFLPYNQEEERLEKEPVVVTASNYRSVNAILGRPNRKDPSESIPSFGEKAQQYCEESMGRKIPSIALKVSLTKASFMAREKEFYNLNYGFHGVFQREQVIQARDALVNNDCFDGSTQELLGEPSEQKVLVGTVIEADPAEHQQTMEF